MFFKELINGSFKKRKFIDKIVLEPCSGEIQGYMDGDRMIWMVEDDWKESAARNIAVVMNCSRLHFQKTRTPP